MSEKETNEEPKQPTDPTVGIEDLDVTEADEVKGGREKRKDTIEINSFSW